MKYYVSTDIHGFFTLFREALERVGYFTDEEPHKLVLLGDLMDRGVEAVPLQDFILKLLVHNDIILVKGNHESLFEELVTQDNGFAYSHHVSNGTYGTALQLTGFEAAATGKLPYQFAAAARATPFYQQIIPAMLDWYETSRYIFAHGWIPCIHGRSGYGYYSEWRDASPGEWEMARWYNGMDAVRTCREEKTILCGHWHASYGHARYEGRGAEFGPDADFSPFRAPGIVALDACTAYSHRVNIEIVEDDPM